MASYRKPAFAGAREEDTKEDLEIVLAELAERNAPASPEVINALLEQRREVKARALLASRIDLKNHGEILDSLEQQVQIGKDSLERFGIDVNGREEYGRAPDWQEVRNEIKNEHLIAAQTMSLPTLLLIPPRTTASMIWRIDRHRLPKQKNCRYPGWWTLSFEFFRKFWEDDTNYLRDWSIAITEGMGVSDPIMGAPAITRFAKREEKIKKDGQQVMDSARAWLTHWMLQAHQDLWIDQFAPPTALKKTLDGQSLITVKWEDRRIRFDLIPVDEDCGPLGTRGIIWVKK